MAALSSQVCGGLCCRTVRQLELAHSNMQAYASVSVRKARDTANGAPATTAPTDLEQNKNCAAAGQPMLHSTVSVIQELSRQ